MNNGPERGEPGWDNVYFEGNVRSRDTVIDGRRATQGEIEPGEYIFSTSSDEHVTILAGFVEVKLPGSESWLGFGPGQKFMVQAGREFGIRAADLASYECLYFDRSEDGNRIARHTGSWDGIDRRKGGSLQAGRKIAERAVTDGKSPDQMFENHGEPESNLVREVDLSDVELRKRVTELISWGRYVDVVEAIEMFDKDDD